MLYVFLLLSVRVHVWFAMINSFINWIFITKLKERSKFKRVYFFDFLFKYNYSKVIFQIWMILFTKTSHYDLLNFTVIFLFLWYSVYIIYLKLSKWLYCSWWKAGVESKSSGYYHTQCKFRPCSNTVWWFTLWCPIKILLHHWAPGSHSST